MGSNILVVEDDQIQRNVLCEILQLHGYTVMFADASAEAGQLIKANPPDIILLDITLRDENGIDVCRQLKVSPETGLIPVILISGLSDTEARMRGIEAGADEFISKPFSISHLLNLVGDFLKREKLQSRQTEVT
jgi:DNA-binding response OmpR family regulator